MAAELGRGASLVLLPCSPNWGVAVLAIDVLGSEQFRSALRTRQPLYGSLSVR
jgi:hypothetical protein